MPLLVKQNERLFFIHIPKTGGSSIYKIFENSGWSQNDDFGSVKKGQQHAIRNEYKKHIDKNTTKFTVIRNPISRIQSELRGNYKYYKKIIQPWNPDDCLKYIFQNELNRRDNHFKKIIDFINPKKIKKENIYIYRFEDNWKNKLIEDFSLLGDFPHEKGDSYDENLNVEFSISSIDMIKNYYKADFKYFYSDYF